MNKKKTPIDTNHLTYQKFTVLIFQETFWSKSEECKDKAIPFIWVYSGVKIELQFGCPAIESNNYVFLVTKELVFGQIIFQHITCWAVTSA